MRSLTELQGGPTVLVLCHPTKNATADNLIPRGGGSFIAEIDGNLCARKSDSAVELHRVEQNISVLGLFRVCLLAFLLGN